MNPVRYLFLDPEKYRREFSEPDAEKSPFDIEIPLVDLPDPIIRQIYYFRWHTFCKHLKKTPCGWVVTEFLPDVPWAGKYNTICCPAGHHFYEGRWLHDVQYLDENAKFWLSSEEAEPRRYSFWAADSIYAMCKAQGDLSFAGSLLQNMISNYSAWESEKKTEIGLYWQIDDRDGMEYSVGGSGYRPTINSYQYGDAMAIAEIAERIGEEKIAREFREKAAELKEKINDLLWNAEASFYQTKTKEPIPQFANVREEVGYVPWYFDIPPADRSVAWKFLNDPHYFQAPFGPTTAEQCHPDFMKSFRHECLWNGPSWPFATSQTLTALGNLLCNVSQDVMTEADYFDLLKRYANSHFLTTETGEKIPFIDEDLDPYTGEWLARKNLRAMQPPRPDVDRGRDYNHSTFCDLVISGLAGIRANMEETLTIHPLFTAEQMSYFCADGILYHGHSLSVLWDQAGEQYHKGKGLLVFCDGIQVASASRLSELVIDLPK